MLPKLESLVMLMAYLPSRTAQTALRSLSESYQQASEVKSNTPIDKSRRLKKDVLIERSATIKYFFFIDI